MDKSQWVTAILTILVLVLTALKLLLEIIKATIELLKMLKSPPKPLQPTKRKRKK